VVASVVHAPSPPDAGPDLCFWFKMFSFVFFFFVCVFSQFSFVMLKSYWTICWPRG